MAPSSRLDALSLGAILLTVLFWASAFAGIRAGLTAFTPEHLTLYRFLVAALVMGLYAVAGRLPVPNARELGRIFVLAFLGLTLYHLLLNIGEQSVPAGTASLIVASGPVVTALLATRFLGERLSVLGWVGTLISLSGVLLIVLGRGEALAFTHGALMIVAAACLASVYFVFQRPVVARLGPLPFTVWSMILAALPLLIFTSGFAEQLRAAPLSAHLGVIYLGIFPTLGYLLWSFALSRVSASVTSSFLYVSPVFAILIAWLWQREVPSTASLLGGAVALVGVVLVNTLGRPSKQEVQKS